MKLIKKIFSCWILGFHDWTCNANEGIKPTKEEAKSGKLGFWMYAKMYCKNCNKVSDLSIKLINDCKRTTSYQTVDVAVIKKISPVDIVGDRSFRETWVLMGKKKHEDAYRFIGGFVDVEDNSLEEAAKRELLEECGSIDASLCKYIGSFRIDDPRYRNSKDAIMTAFFCCEYICGEPSPNDDIHEIRWFDLKGDIPIVKEHMPLLIALRKF